MLDKLLDALRKQLRPPGVTPIFGVTPDRKAGAILVQKGEHQFDLVQLPAPKGLRPQHTYESLYDFTADLKFRAAAALLKPESSPIACTFSIASGGTLEALSADDALDADAFNARHPRSESWEAWMGLLGKKHSPAALMARVRELPSPTIVVVEDGPNNEPIEREVDFGALVYQQLGQLKVGAVYESATTALKNGLVVAQLDSRDRQCTAKLPDEFYVVSSIIEGGRDHKVRVIVTMEIDGSTLFIGLVIAPAQKSRLEAEVARELRDLVQVELGPTWSVHCGTLGGREVTESPVAVLPGGGQAIHHFIKAHLAPAPGGPTPPPVPAGADAPPASDAA